VNDDDDIDHDDDGDDDDVKDKISFCAESFASSFCTHILAIFDVFTDMS
jgi:hypothetical protein